MHLVTHLLEDLSLERKSSPLLTNTVPREYDLELRASGSGALKRIIHDPAAQNPEPMVPAWEPRLRVLQLTRLQELKGTLDLKEIDCLVRPPEDITNLKSSCRARVYSHRVSNLHILLAAGTVVSVFYKYMSGTNNPATFCAFMIELA